MNETIAFRFDAASNIGIGHLMRCLALAEELIKRGNKCVFLTKTIEEKLIKKIQKAGCIYEKLPKELDILNDVKNLISYCIKNEIRWVVIDHYGIETYYLENLKKQNLNVLSVDDTANTFYPSDIVINQNIGAEKLNFLTSDKTKLLLGTNYVLMRNELLKRHLKKPKKEVKNILITLGGTDPDNFILKVLKNLEDIDQKIKRTVILGPFNKNNDKIEKYKKNTNQNIEIIRSPEDITDAYLNSDIAISAGGTSSYELAYFGIPNIIITVADNQENIAYEMNKEQVSISIGRKPEFKPEILKNNIKTLIDNHSLRSKMSEKGKKLIDGKGKIRVVDFMERLS
ncbi:MAG: UDP-2,4-diacetamido-2,4,6-trideoxy-beta-L-altropyranose hydrolase [Thermoplasmatales archaeon]|nr:MAG: UDP-2,4-diacetamido-2,4,6-trideoxy-beta-L-altropyranose hydrolase [Thermoplasmatales archaeon]